MSLKQIVEEVDTPAGRAFDAAIQACVVISLISFALETVPGLTSSTYRALGWIETTTVAIFTVEYVTRICVSDYPMRFMRSFLGTVDLIAILPFYMSTGIDLRSIRIVRLFRVVRVLKLARYSEAMLRLRGAVAAVKEELVLFGAAAFVLLYVASVGIYYFERGAQPEKFASIFHSLWWAVITLTTVGYGDVYPVTVGGRVLTFVVLALGLGIVAVPTGLLSAALSRARDA